MKTHEHALISLGYAATMSLFSGKGMLDPGIYIAVIIGGELIDLIDHPLYQLVFARNDPAVVEARKAWKTGGIRSAWRVLNQKEDERKFNKLRLHNVFSLSLIAIVAIVTSLFMKGSIYSFVMLGAFLLHMLTDIYGDFKLSGNYNNWMWVLPSKFLNWLGHFKIKLVLLAWMWWANIFLAFILVTFRWMWQLVQPSTYYGLFWEAKNIETSGLIWLSYGPLIFLMLYFFTLFLVITAGVHKINLETTEKDKKWKSRFNLGSLKTLKEFLFGKRQKRKRSFGQLILRMQSDQAVWIIFLTLFIALVLLAETWLGFHTPVVILLTPIIPALFFGTLLHTTIGEFGGVQGVLLAAFLNIVLSRFHLQEAWPISYGYLLFLAACGAWLLGLLGAFFIKNHKRMSLSVFVVRFQLNESKNGIGQKNQRLLMIAQRGLEIGYKNAHDMLFGKTKATMQVKAHPIECVITTNSGCPTPSNHYFNLSVEDKCIPILQDVAYVLLDNDLISESDQIRGFGLLPILPRHRVILDKITRADMAWEGNNLNWRSSRHPVKVETSENPEFWLPHGKQLALLKTWGEFFDNLVTRQTIFRTTLYLFPSQEDPCSVILCGITSSRTSTKEYTTVESEIYSKETLQAILGQIQLESCQVLETTAARIFYPRLSIDDQETLGELNSSLVILPNETCLSNEVSDLLNKSLELSPDKNQILDATADIGRRILVLAVQLGIAYLASTLGYDWLAQIIQGF